MNGGAVVRMVVEVAFTGEQKQLAAIAAARIMGTYMPLRPALGAAVLKAMTMANHVDGWPENWQIGAVEIVEVKRD